MAELYSAVYLKDVRGIDTSTSDELIPDNCLASGTQNVIPNPAGGGNLIKRYGTGKFNVSATATTKVSSLSYLGSFLWYTEETGGISYIKYGGTGVTAYSTTTGGTDKPCWREFGGYTVVSTYSYTQKTNDNVNFSDSGLGIISYAIEPYNRYLFGIDYSNGHLRWSSVGDMATWPLTNEYIFDVILYGLRTHGTDLVVFGKDQFHVLQGYGPTFQVIASNKAIGAVDNNAIVETPLGLFFWSWNSGICRIVSGGYNTVDLVSLRKYPTLGYINQFDYVSAIYLENIRCVRFYVYDSTNKVGYRFDYYPETDSLYYSTGKGCKMTAATSFASVAYIGGHSDVSTNAVYYEYPTFYSDDGTTIDAKIVTKRMATGSPSSIKVIGSVFPEIKIDNTSITGTVKYRAMIDNKTGTSYAASIDITPTTTEISESKYGINLQGRKIQHILEDDIVGTRVHYNLITESGTVNQQL